MKHKFNGVPEFECPYCGSENYHIEYEDEEGFGIAYKICTECGQYYEAV